VGVTPSIPCGGKLWCISVSVSNRENTKAKKKFG
jgi:hypothetical protein